MKFNTMAQINPLHGHGQLNDSTFQKYKTAWQSKNRDMSVTVWQIDTIWHSIESFVTTAERTPSERMIHRYTEAVI